MDGGSASLAGALVCGAIQDAFWTVLLVVVIGGAAVGLFTLFAFVFSGRAYEQIGRGGLSINEDRGRGHPSSAPAPTSAAGARERDEEIRQLLTARNERRRRRGEAAVDVEAELQRLTAPAIDAGLRAEIRQLVVARNERRMRAGQEPLDVDEEVDRQVRELGGTTGG